MGAVASFVEDVYDAVVDVVTTVIKIQFLMIIHIYVKVSSSIGC
jgi:hypothetical protein